MANPQGHGAYYAQDAEKTPTAGTPGRELHHVLGELLLWYAERRVPVANDGPHNSSPAVTWSER